MDAETIQLLEQSLAESAPVIEHEETTNNQSLDKSLFNGNGIGNGACYLGVNLELIDNCRRAIEQLKNYSSLSAPIEIAATLEQSLGKTKENDYWLKIAQFHNPRQIIWVLKDIAKQTARGEITIKDFFAYFAFLLGKREKKIAFQKKEAAK